MPQEGAIVFWNGNVPVISAGFLFCECGVGLEAEVQYSVKEDL
jgi:hypothetical protein